MRSSPTTLTAKNIKTTIRECNPVTMIMTHMSIATSNINLLLNIMIGTITKVSKKMLLYTMIEAITKANTKKLLYTMIDAITKASNLKLKEAGAVIRSSKRIQNMMKQILMLS